MLFCKLFLSIVFRFIAFISLHVSYLNYVSLSVASKTCMTILFKISDREGNIWYKTSISCSRGHIGVCLLVRIFMFCVLPSVEMKSQWLQSDRLRSVWWHHLKPTGKMCWILQFMSLHFEFNESLARAHWQIIVFYCCLRCLHYSYFLENKYALIKIALYIIPVYGNLLII